MELGLRTSHIAAFYVGVKSGIINRIGQLSSQFFGILTYHRHLSSNIFIEVKAKYLLMYNNEPAVYLLLPDDANIVAMYQIITKQIKKIYNN